MGSGMGEPRLNGLAAGALVVRTATDQDAAAAQLLSDRAFDELRTIYRPKAAASAAGPPLIRLIAEADGHLVGTVQYAIESERLHLRGLAVEPAHRRTGVARALIEQLAGLAQTENLRALSLYTIGQTGNVAVFERLGFGTIREEPATWAECDSGELLTDVYMERPL